MNKAPVYTKHPLLMNTAIVLNVERNIFAEQIINIDNVNNIRQK